MLKMMDDCRKIGFCELVKSDLARLGPVSFRSFLKHYFVPRGGSFPYVVWLRVEQCLRRGGWIKRFLGAVFYVIYRHYEFKYGIHANPNIQIGGGLLIAHGGGVHLNCSSIGRNLTVYQGVTFGVQDGERPTVGDDVTVYPNSVVVGGIIIGNRATIGALSYVSHDVAADTVVAGAPAHIIKKG